MDEKSPEFHNLLNQVPEELRDLLRAVVAVKNAEIASLTAVVQALRRHRPDSANGDRHDYPRVTSVEYDAKGRVLDTTDRTHVTRYTYSIRDHAADVCPINDAAETAALPPTPRADEGESNEPDQPFIARP